VRCIVRRIFIFRSISNDAFLSTPFFLTTQAGDEFGSIQTLYVDGKVCISLLGVTSATDQSQRWNPDVSSLAQLMLSVQTQILGEQEPYYNEGNGMFEQMLSNSFHFVWHRTQFSSFHFAVICSRVPGVAKAYR